MRLRLLRQPDRVAIEREVGLPVLEVRFQPATHAELMGRSNRNVAAVEEAMHVGAKKETFVEAVRSAMGNTSNMRRLKCGQGLLAGCRATSLVGVDHEDPKCTLTESL